MNPASRAYALRLTRTTSSTSNSNSSTSNRRTIGAGCSGRIHLFTDKASTTTAARRVFTSRPYSSTTPATTHGSSQQTTIFSVPQRRSLEHTLLARIQPSACFSTHAATRQLKHFSSSAAASTTTRTDQQQHAAKDTDNRELKALVGLPCPGCGSAFQITHPQEPGYLTRLPDGPLSSKTKSLDNNNKKSGGKKGPAFDPNATSMSHAQYEEYLKTLDPSILQEMGILPPPPPSSSSSTIDATESDAGSSGSPGESGALGAEGETEELLDRKPVLASSTPARLICHRCHSLSHHASPLANSSTLPSVMFPSPPAPVPKHLETLAQSKTSTVVLVVDLIDFPLSLPQPIIQELLKAKKSKKSSSGGYSTEVKKEYPTTPIILVGNKFDVMPTGTRKHNVIQTIQQYLTQQGLDENVRAIHLVSAKNPVGDEIRMLLKSIGTAWAKSGKGNVVMVGAENVGKSQLLNAFLREGGRWRPNEAQVERIRFGDERAERQKKLSRLLGSSSGSGLDSNNNDDSNNEEGEEDKEWAAMTGKDAVGADMDRYETVYKGRGQEKLEKYQTTVSNVPGTTLERIKVPLSVLSRFMGTTYKEVQTKWLMDTPGIRPASGQLTSWLTLDELKVTLPKKVLKPVSFTLEEGKSFFLGGLVRIDCLSIGKPTTPQQEATSTSSDDQDSSTPPAPARRARGSNPAPKLTVFTTLPLHKTSTAGADKFLQKTAQGQLTILQPPFGSPERLAAFPGLQPVSSKDIVIVNRAPSPTPYSSSSSEGGERRKDSQDPFARLDGNTSPTTSASSSSDDDAFSHLTRREKETARLQWSGQYGICDVVFSGIGWVMVSGKFRGEDQAVRLKVWTPAGQGAMVREPCLVPEFASQVVGKTAGGIRQKLKVFQAVAWDGRGKGEDEGGM